MAITLAFTPMSLISKSLYQVFYQRTAERVNQRTSIAPFFRKFIKNALLIVVPTFALLYFVLPTLTRWLLGAEWEISGHYIRVMLPWLLMSVLVAPICFLSRYIQETEDRAVLGSTAYRFAFVGSGNWYLAA